MSSLKKKWNIFLFRNSDKGIPNLSKSIVISMATLFVAHWALTMLGRPGFLSYLNFDRDLIFSGQVWRLITFIFIPPNLSFIFIIFALYLFWYMGSSLEAFWGVLKFNLFYFCGVIFTIIGGMILGSTVNEYLNFSILLAFAIINPNFEIMLFFFIRVKMKYIAIINLIFYAVMLVIVPLAEKTAIIISFVNILLFFGPTMYRGIRNFIERKIHKRKWQRKMRDIKWK